MAGESLTYCLQMGMMAEESRRLQEHIVRLCRLAVAQLIGMNISPERMGRSQLAQMISRALGWTLVWVSRFCGHFSNSLTKWWEIACFA